MRKLILLLAVIISSKGLLAFEECSKNRIEELIEKSSSMREFVSEHIKEINDNPLYNMQDPHGEMQRMTMASSGKCDEVSEHVDILSTFDNQSKLWLVEVEDSISLWEELEGKCREEVQFKLIKLKESEKSLASKVKLSMQNVQEVASRFIDIQQNYCVDIKEKQN